MNALLPISKSVDGRFKDVMLLPLNALLPIVVTPSGITTSFNGPFPLFTLNVDAGIVVSDFDNVILKVLASQKVVILVILVYPEIQDLSQAHLLVLPLILMLKVFVALH